MTSKPRVHPAAFTAALLLLCRPAVIAEPSPAGVAPGAAPVAARTANYELSPGDSVAIAVFREPDLSAQQRLSRDGTINLPLIGVVHLAGKNTNDASALIAGMLAKGYLIHPQVSVSIVDLAKIKFTVLGQVSSPGAYEVPGDQSVDLLAAVAKAGGFTRLAEPAKVIVKRSTDGQEQAFKVDVKRLMNDKKSPRFLIQANDTISVPERFF